MSDTETQQSDRAEAPVPLVDENEVRTTLGDLDDMEFLLEEIEDKIAPLALA